MKGEESSSSSRACSPGHLHGGHPQAEPAIPTSDARAPGDEVLRDEDVDGCFNRCLCCKSVLPPQQVALTAPTCDVATHSALVDFKQHQAATEERRGTATETGS